MNQSKVPEGWEELILKDLLSSIQNGSRPEGGADFESGEIPSLGGENIFMEGGVKYSPVKRIPDKFFKSMKKGILQDKDVLINKDGANTGKTGLYSEKRYKDAAINEHLFILRGDSSKVTQEYLYYVLVSEDGNRQIKDRITGSAQPGLNSQFIKAFKVLKPKSLTEQQKIVHVLLTVDNTIDKTKELIEKNKKIKQGLMQNLFLFGTKSRKPKSVLLNKKESKIPEDWQIKNILQTSTLKGRIGWQGLTTKEYLKEGDFFLVTGTDLKSGKIDWNSCSCVDRKRFEQDRNIQLKFQDILITKDGTIGKVAYINILRKQGTLNSGVFVLRPKNQEYEPKYLYYVLMSFIFDRFIENLKAGSTIAHLYQKDFIYFEFPVPDDIKEQKNIINIFDKINEKIQSEESYLQKLLKIKAGLMQDLLTGKVRMAV